MGFWGFAGRSSNNTFVIGNVEDDITYNLRAKIINTIGVSSSYVTANHLVIGKTTPPNDIENFRAEPNGNQLVLPLKLYVTPSSTLPITKVLLLDRPAKI